MELNKELLEKALIGEVITNYFVTGTPLILSSKVYADNTQGKVLAYKDEHCWQLVYKIADGKFELIPFLSGIMELKRELTEGKE